MTSVKLLVAHHKPGIAIKSDMYLPVHVGKILSKYNLPMQGDDFGDNISKLNPVFCEMTAIYWGWKNIKADYIGLCHYRRYFTFMKEPLYDRFLCRLKYVITRSVGNIYRVGLDYSYSDQISTSDLDFFKDNIQDFEKRIRKHLESNKVDFIVPTPYYFSCRDNESFFSVIGKDHIVKLQNIVKELTPDFYEFVEESLKTNCLYAANMFIFRKDYFDEYCNLVFPILLNHLERTKLDMWCRDPIEEKCYARISGYLAEILTNAYIFKLQKENKRGLFVNSIFLNA